MSRYWNDWYYKPTSRIRVDNGIKAKHKSGDFSDRWWSKRWIEVLESFNIGARLQRGQSYARSGQVLEIHIDKGTITAKVQGSRPKPYDVTIQLKQLSEQEWSRIIEYMASKAIYAAKLLNGEMPRDIETVFKEIHIPLFPEKYMDLETSCSCPDTSNPCKHIAAVYYIFAERFDEDPFLIFTLRGKSKDEIMAILRNKRDVNETKEPPKEKEAEKISLESYWAPKIPLDSFYLSSNITDNYKLTLQKLGDPGFKIFGEDATKIIGEVYEKARDKALKQIKKINDEIILE
ncbi:MAG: SWIM zinc finger family protein [Thermoplasmata archaeon]